MFEEDGKNTRNNRKTSYLEWNVRLHAGAQGNAAFNLDAEDTALLEVNNVRHSCSQSPLSLLPKWFRTGQVKIASPYCPESV